MPAETLDIELKGVSDTGSIVGYASLFGGPADAVGDVVSKGAFVDSLAATMPNMLREHKGEPVGAWSSATEDEIGLRVEGVVTDPATLADLRAGRLDGLSIGFIAVKARRDGIGRRTLDHVTLPEISLVKRPASSRARVLSVKSLSENDTMSENQTTAGDNTGDKTPDIETRVGALEKTVAAIDTRLKAVEENGTKAVKSLDRIEIALKRPGAAIETKSDGSTEMAAFERYLRHGREGLDALEVKALKVSDDTAGGYLAPPEFLATIDKNVVLFSPVRGLATVRSTARGEVQIPKRTGKPTAHWVGEEDDRAETSSAYGQSSYTVREIAGYVDVTLQLLEDAAVDIAAEIAADVAEEIGYEEGAAFVNGTGADRPTGFMVDTGLGFTKSGAAAAITADSLIDLFHAIPAPYRTNATFGMNSATLAAVRKLKTSDGQYLTMMTGINGAPATTILGRPVVEMVDMPDIAADAFPIVFGDFKAGFRVFDRVGTSILRDDFSVRTKGKVRFHFRKRLAAGVAKAEALRKLKIAA